MLATIDELGPAPANGLDVEETDRSRARTRLIIDMMFRAATLAARQSIPEIPTPSNDQRLDGPATCYLAVGKADLSKIQFAALANIAGLAGLRYPDKCRCDRGRTDRPKPKRRGAATTAGERASSRNDNRSIVLNSPVFVARKNERGAAARPARRPAGGKTRARTR